MNESPYPGGMSELDFVDAYTRSALRKPQVAADAALRTLVFAEAGERAILASLIGQELAEAARRLTAVYLALANRTYSVGRSLLLPLPGADDWMDLVRKAGTYSPEEILHDLSLPETALQHARNLRSQPDLASLTGMVATAESGNAMLLIPGLGNRNVPSESWYTGVSAEGIAFVARFGVEEGDSANLADLTADLTTIARGFLGAYLDARRGAGRPD